MPIPSPRRGRLPATPIQLQSRLKWVHSCRPLVTDEVARASGGSIPPATSRPSPVTPGHLCVVAKVASSFLRREGRLAAKLFTSPLGGPALLHLLAVACRSAGHASVPASGTWRRPRGKATKPRRQPSFPSGKGSPPVRGGWLSLPPKGKESPMCVLVCAGCPSPPRRRRLPATSSGLQSRPEEVH